MEVTYAHLIGTKLHDHVFTVADIMMLVLTLFAGVTVMEVWVLS